MKSPTKKHKNMKNIALIDCKKDTGLQLKSWDKKANLYYIQSHWERGHQVKFFRALPMHVSMNDFKYSVGGYKQICTFYKVGEFAKTESANNEVQLYWASIFLFFISIPQNGNYYDHGFINK